MPTQKPAEIEKFILRLFSKISRNLEEIQIVQTYLMDDANVGVIAFGSVVRSARRAVDDARAAGIRAGLLHLVTLSPYPRRATEQVLKRCRAVLVPEMNMGQISREVQRVNRAGCRIVKLNRVNGGFITPTEIGEALARL